MISDSEEGFTFIEILTALAILSLTGFLVWTGLSNGMAYIEKLSLRNREVSEMARLEYLFREEINRLGPSYWEAGISEEYKGVYQSEGILYLETDQGAIPFYLIDLIELKQTERAVELCLQTESEREITIKAPFGKLPLVGGSHD